MRARRIAAAVTGVLVAGVVGQAAIAAPINQYTNEQRYDYACASFWSYAGQDYAYVNVCGERGGWTDQWGSNSWQYVWARRTVGTCDGSGCTDSYSEEYAGPAADDELLIDAEAGIATIDIELSGTQPGDSCHVTLNLTATDTWTYDNPWPVFYGYADPQNPYLRVESGDQTVGVWSSPPFWTEVERGENAEVYRQADGAGSVCSWVTPGTAPDGASISSYREARERAQVNMYGVLPG